MKPNFFYRFTHPFEYIAGGKALVYGLAGMGLAVIFSIMAGLHFHGLLHYGAAPNSAWWVFAAEHLIVWLIPALLFWLGGMIFSPSRIRAIDVLGTTVFAQLPFIPMIFFYMLPFMRSLMVQLTVLSTGDTTLTAMRKWFAQPGVMIGITLIMLLSILFLVWVLVWMYNALRVSCNLKGGKAAAVFIVAVMVGDILCRLLIGLMY